MTATASVSEELVELERRTWSALTSEEDAAESYEQVLDPDMVMVLPGMVLERAETMESWMGHVPWCDFEIEDVRVVPIARNAALLTYRATARRARIVPLHPALPGGACRGGAGRTVDGAGAAGDAAGR